MSGLNFLEKLLNGAEVKFVPMGQIISRVREKGKNNRQIKTVYSEPLAKLGIQGRLYRAERRNGEVQAAISGMMQVTTPTS